MAHGTGPFGTHAGERGVSVETDWNKVGHNSIVIFAGLIVVLIGLPGNLGAAHPFAAVVHTLLAYAWALVCIGYIYVQAKMIREREVDPMTTLDHGLSDISRSQWPRNILLLLLIVKPIVYVAFFGEWHPFVWFAPWQWLAGISALATVYLDIEMLSWFGFRIAQLQNELNVEKTRR